MTSWRDAGVKHYCSGWCPGVCKTRCERRALMDDLSETRFVTCDACGGDGRRWLSRYGGNDPDVWDGGTCTICDGKGEIEVSTEPCDLDDAMWEGC